MICCVHVRSILAAQAEYSSLPLAAPDPYRSVEEPVDLPKVPRMRGIHAAFWRRFLSAGTLLRSGDNGERHAHPDDYWPPELRRKGSVSFPGRSLRSRMRRPGLPAPNDSMRTGRHQGMCPRRNSGNCKCRCECDCLSQVQLRQIQANAQSRVRHRMKWPAALARKLRNKLSRVRRPATPAHI